MKVSNTNCVVWNSYPDTNETVTWSGGVENGKADGKGILKWFKNGALSSSYEGNLRGGLADGRGIAKAEEMSWEGEWEKGRLVSKVITIVEPNGTKFVGEHRDGSKEGKGVLTFKSGHTYKGEFKNDAQHGHGEETLVGGQKYVGEYREGRFNGKGTLYLPDGATIIGTWKNSQLEGVGEYRSAQGQSANVRMVNGALQAAQ